MNSLNRWMLLLTVLLIGAFALPAGVPALATEIPTAAGSMPEAPALYRIRFSDVNQLNDLAANLDVWEVDHTDGTLLALLEPAHALALRLNGVELEYSAELPVIARASTMPPIESSDYIPGFPCYRLTSTLERDMRLLAKNNPDLVQRVKIGNSWERAQLGPESGHAIQALILTNRAIQIEKFRFLIVAEVHARELVTSEIAMRFAEYLVANYARDPDVTWLLDYGEVHIVPLANPDGREYADQLYYWRKNTNSTDGCSISQPGGFTFGVDLNRNFGFRWNGCISAGCSSGDPCAATFRGESAVSEPETSALQRYARSIFPAQRDQDISASAPVTTTGLLVSLHSYAELVMYPWAWTTEKSPNATELDNLGQRLAEPLGYRVCQSGEPGCLYLLDGDLADWAYAKLGVAAFTMEYGTAFFEQCSNFEDVILQPAIESLLTGYKHARRPYMSTDAPPIQSVELSDTQIQPGDPLTVTVRMDGSALQAGDTIAIQFSREAPSWTAEAKQVDQFTRTLSNPQATAYITATIDTRSWPVGRRLLLFESVGPDGEPGVPTALYVEAFEWKTTHFPLMTGGKRTTVE